MMTAKYVPPSHDAKAFHCPHCGAYAHQKWCKAAEMRTGPPLSYGEAIKGVSMSICSNCKKYAVWVDNIIVYPRSSAASLPVEDMPDDVREDFLEARKIVDESPRAAAALLRLALQKLMVHLGEKGKNINDDIASLVEKGLPEKIRKALDTVRVIGNNAVHPGKVDLRDDKDTALLLFDTLNIVVEVMITQSRKINEIYERIPHSTKESIRERDKRK